MSNNLKLTLIVIIVIAAAAVLSLIVILGAGELPAVDTAYSAPEPEPLTIAAIPAIEPIEEETEETADTVALPGFEMFEYPQGGFRIQYPVEWMYADESWSAEEFHAIIGEVYGQGAVDLFNELNESDAGARSEDIVWYDFPNADGGFFPNARLISGDADGITQEDLKSPVNLTEFQEFFEDLYSRVFENFKSAGNMTGKMLGDNYFAVYKFDCSIHGANVSGYQAMTSKNGLLYTFSATTFRGKSDETTYEKMLSTLEFY